MFRRMKQLRNKADFTLENVNQAVDNADSAVGQSLVVLKSVASDVVDLIDDVEKWAENGIELELEIMGQLVPVKLRFKPRES